MKKVAVVAMLAVLPMVGWGAESGFLEDYSILETRAQDRGYVAPGTFELLSDYEYNAVMVDQPEVFMSPDSEYQGAKPDHIKTLADTARFALMERLEDGGYQLADRIGPDVLFLRWAITDLYLKKKKRNILSYTPVGLVVHATAQAAVRDLWRKIDIVELKIEVEVIDGANGNLLAAGVMQRGTRKAKGQRQELVSWEALDAVMQTIGAKLRCTLDNARKEESRYDNCAEILIEAES